MIHHGCVHVEGRPVMTTAVMGHDEEYRCGNCKRRVPMDVSEEVRKGDVEHLYRIDGPYPEGVCSIVGDR